jgi:iron complex outermembrane receptor protein
MKSINNHRASMLLFQFKLRRSSTMHFRKKLFAASCLIILSSLAEAAYGQQTRDQAVAAMRKVDAKEMDTTYTTAAAFAQKLVDEALAKHPEILLIAIHAAPPGHKNLIVASNFGRIGKIGDEDDMRCIRTGKSNLEISEKGDHFEDELILQDSSGKTIGALGVVFNYKAGDDKAALEKIAIATRDEMKARIKSLNALFGPAQ